MELALNTWELAKVVDGDATVVAETIGEEPEPEKAIPNVDKR